MIFRINKYTYLYFVERVILVFYFHVIFSPEFVLRYKEIRFFFMVQWNGMWK